MEYWKTLPWKYMDKAKLYNERNEKEVEAMWEEIAYWLSLTEEDRKTLGLPIQQNEIYESFGIPESTFYWQLQQDDYTKKIIRFGLIRARKGLPKVLAALEKNAGDGKEKSIEIFLKFIAELADKIDHTTQGEKMNSVIILPQKDGIATNTLETNGEASDSSSSTS